MCSQTHKFRKPGLEMWVASIDHMADQLIREAMIKILFSQMCVLVLRAVILNILCHLCNKDFMKVCVHLLFSFFNSDNEKSGHKENPTCGYTLWSGYDFKNMILRLQNVSVLYSLKTLSGGNNLDVRRQRTHVNTPPTKYKTLTKLHKFNCGCI
jgi:hypothetical protein